MQSTLNIHRICSVNVRIHYIAHNRKKCIFFSSVCHRNGVLTTDELRPRVDRLVYLLCMKVTVFCGTDSWGNLLLCHRSGDQIKRMKNCALLSVILNIHTAHVFHLCGISNRRIISRNKWRCDTAGQLNRECTWYVLKRNQVRITNDEQPCHKIFVVFLCRYCMWT
jgi:hypothetical protein